MYLGGRILSLEQLCVLSLAKRKLKTNFQYTVLILIAFRAWPLATKSRQFTCTALLHNQGAFLLLYLRYATQSWQNFGERHELSPRKFPLSTTREPPRSIPDKKTRKQHTTFHWSFISSSTKANQLLNGRGPTVWRFFFCAGSEWKWIEWARGTGRWTVRSTRPWFRTLSAAIHYTEQSASPRARDACVRKDSMMNKQFAIRCAQWYLRLVFNSSENCTTIRPGLWKSQQEFG